MRLFKGLFTATVILAAACLSSSNVLAVEPLDDATLATSLDALIDSHPAAERTTITLKVVDMESGDVLYDRGGGKLLTPASNLKIYTAAAALDLLGPEYRWTTEVLANGEIRGGVCRGGLLIHSTGDPMMDTEQLADLADQLVNIRKLKRVMGTIRVITHPGWEDVPLKGTGWMWDDDPDYYNMSIRSTMLNFNVLTVTVEQDKGKPVMTLDPVSDWPPIDILPRFDNSAVGDVLITRQPFTERILVCVNPRPDAEPVSERVTVHDPSLWIAAVFKQMLIDRGVECRTGTDKKATDMNALLNARQVVSSQSKTLTEALRHFLKVSENAVGEMVLLKLAETYSEPTVIAWPAGAKVISDWLVNTAGLEEGSFRLVDGSGLSRYNLISADSSVKLLTFMKTHEHFEPFFDGLPVRKVAFEEGEKWDGVPLAEFDDERVFAKSGGMSGVATLSGYVKTLDGRWLAFSFLSNGYIGSNKPVLELRNAVYSELVRYRAAAVGTESAKPVSP